MATKAELLNDLTKAQLEELASNHGVPLSGSTKAQYVKQLESSQAVRVADIEAYSDQEGSMADDETVDETEDEDYESTTSLGPDDPISSVVADAGDPDADQEVEPPDSPPEPTTPIHMREPEMATAPPSQAPAVALAEADADRVTIDAQGRIFRNTPDVLISESAAAAGGEAPDEEQLESHVGWVRLGQLSGDLEKYSGREAAIIKAPQTVNDDPGFTTTGGKLVAGEDAVITVRTRDSDSAILQITAEDIEDNVSSRVELPTAG